MIIHSKVKDYRVEMVKDIWSGNPEFSGMSKINRPFFFIDGNLFKFYGPQLKELVGSHFVLKIDADERNKEYIKLGDYYRALIEAGFTRNDSLVTLGGGIVQDISGFIASTLYRGIKWVYVPTTLLAQADSCIGSKTSINFGEAKNLVGTFYPPDVILVDTALTKTLPAGDFNSGVGEIIKFHLLSDADGYQRLKDFLASALLSQGPKLKAIIDSTLQIKRSYFERDEFDTGVRNLLNYGHCFGHALESASNFSIPHGIAVIVGMDFVNHVSVARGLMSVGLAGELEGIFKPFYPKIDFNQVTPEKILMYLKKDKKRVGPGLTMILGKILGDFAKYDDITEEEVRSAWREWHARHC